MYLLFFSSPSLSLSQLIGVKLSADGALKVKVSSDDMLRLPSPYVLRVIDSKTPTL